MQKLLASTAASQARLGSLPKAMPTLAPEGPVSGPLGKYEPVCGAAAHHSFDARTFYVREHSPHNHANVQFFKCLTMVPPPASVGSYV